MSANRQRFVAPGSSTGLAGVVILEGEGKQVVYSHHGSDPLGDGKPHDAFDVLRIVECGGDFHKALDQARERLGLPAYEAKNTPKIDWAELQPLPNERPTAHTLPPEMIPEPLRPWLVDAASRACLPLEMFAAAAVVAASGLIGRSAVIKPRTISDWTVAPNLWGAIVAPPGAMKSDVINEAFRPVTRLENLAREAFEKAKLEAEVEKLEVEALLKNAKDRARNGKASKDEFIKLTSKLKAIENTPHKRYTTQDTTVEKLGELLRDNPRGITIQRDELASWISNLERDENAIARGFFLTAWNGTSDYTFDRIGRGETHIPSVCVSVFGAIQPKPLDAVFTRLRNDPTRADGLIQRFQVVVYPDALPKWEAPISWPDKKARELAFTVFEQLDKLAFQSPDSEDIKPVESKDIKPVTLAFSREAQTLFNEWHDGLEHRLRSGELDQYPHFASHLAKYRSLAPSLAVVFHLISLAGSVSFDGWADLPLVSLEALQLSLDWCDFLELHARKVYSAELSADVLASHALAEKVKEGKITDGMTLRDIKRKQWAGLTGDALDLAISELEKLNWLRVVETPPSEQGGRPSEIMYLHPKLRKVTV
jgi:hypothetical protein